MSGFFCNWNASPKKHKFLQDMGLIYPLCFVVKGLPGVLWRPLKVGRKSCFTQNQCRGETGETVMVFVIFLLWNFIYLKIDMES